jgi:RimJ/RimL family protein N-acetyltransferase
MLPGERVRLRAPERDDLPTFVRWFNDPEVRHFLAAYLPMSMAQEERWFEERLNAKDEFFFVVEALVDDAFTPIGTITLVGVDWKNRISKFGTMIGEKDYWGQGLGTEATRVLLRFAFGELNLHRVELEVYDFNARAIRSYEKAGFRREGTKRQALFRAGRYRDVHVMGILREEFMERESE